MAVLVAETTGWGSWTSRITQDGEDLTELRISTFRTKGSFELEGETYSVEPEGFWGHHAVLQKGATVIARAEKASLTRRRFNITSAGHQLKLESRSFSGREYVLLLGGQEVGWIRAEGLMKKRVTLEFPDEVPVFLQLFLTYLVLAQSKREAAAAAAGS
ncbi:hypothetical protein ACFL3Z_02255 [Gemmatimonadota bacterium]